MTLPNTAEEVLTQIDDVETEFVNDIGVEKYYGVGLRATLYTDAGDKVNVLGSLVLDPETGSQADHTDPQIFAYPEGMLEGEKTLVSGEDAVEVFEEVFEHASFNSLFQARSDVEIDPSAM